MSVCLMIFEPYLRRKGTCMRVAVGGGGGGGVRQDEGHFYQLFRVNTYVVFSMPLSLRDRCSR